MSREHSRLRRLHDILCSGDCTPPPVEEKALSEAAAVVNGIGVQVENRSDFRFNGGVYVYG